MDEAPNLKLVIVLSGKRKSGKDYVSKLIMDHIGDEQRCRVALLRIAAPIKEQFARDHKLDFPKLLDSTDYKEHHRRAMVEWSERRRSEAGWNCFLEQAIRDESSRDNLIWILNDARRPCDLEFFDRKFGGSSVRLIKLRIEASDEVRASRGWRYTEAIDDQPTECALDQYTDWSFRLSNNCDNSAILDSLTPVFQLIDEALSREKQ